MVADRADAPLPFETVVAPATLWQAWLKVRSRKGGPGGDGETIADFMPYAGQRLARLAQELEVGTYSPGPYRRLLVSKDDGGFRTLAIPCVVDRIAQTAAHAVLGPLLEAEFEPSSYAYRPGRSVRMAVDRVSHLRRQGYLWVVDGDIRAFFDTVEHHRLLARLGRSIGDPRVVDLVSLWLEAYAPEGEGLPQGSPISPLLANIYLDDIDEAIEKEGVRLVRFADDFLLLCRTEVRARGALERMGRLLAGYGLALNPEKTRICSFEDGFRFLGRLFVRSIVLEVSDEGADEDDEGFWKPGRTYAEEPSARGTLADPGRPFALVAPAVATPPLQPAMPKPPLTPPSELALQEGEEVADALAPFLRPLYVLEAGRRVHLRNESFAVMEDEAELIALPPAKVDRIDLGPYVAISDEALRQALAYRVPVFFLDGFGEPQGVLDSRLSGRHDLHLAQAACVLDPDRRLDLARRLVDGRLRNQQGLLKRLNRRRKDTEIDAAVANIRRVRSKLEVAGDVAAAMGREGEGTAHYWPALGRCLEHGWAFRYRRRRPAADPFNAVLNWLSSMLTRDVAALVSRNGLHPGFGALHGTRDGHAGCVFDLVEEFRSPLAEGLAVYLFNNRFVAEADFSCDAAGAVRIGGGARSTVVRQYEAWLDRRVKSSRRRRSTTWRGLIDEQVKAYAAHVLRAEAPYEPYPLDY